MSSLQPDLRIDWCSHKAAAYACTRWHYTKAVPRNKLVKIGVWEKGLFRGAVIYGTGACDALGSRYGLSGFQCCELVRIALRSHAAPVTKIVSLSLRLLKQRCPKLRLVVSFADPEMGHHGGIYQGGNWIYAGMTKPSDELIINGRRRHGRAVRFILQRYVIPGANTLERAKIFFNDPHASVVSGSSKHRYLMPLDHEIRARVLPLSQPYPKRAKQATAEHHSASGGAAPTGALQ